MSTGASRLADAEALTQDIRAFGRSPKQVKGTSPELIAERKRAVRLCKARAAGRLTVAHEAELAEMSGDAAETLMQEIRDFGRLPKEVKGKDPDRIAERNLAQRLKTARAAGRLTVAHEAELADVDGDAPRLAEA